MNSTDQSDQFTYSIRQLIEDLPAERRGVAMGQLAEMDDFWSAEADSYYSELHPGYVYDFDGAEWAKPFEQLPMYYFVAKHRNPQAGAFLEFTRGIEGWTPQERWEAFDEIHLLHQELKSWHEHSRVRNYLGFLLSVDEGLIYINYMPTYRQLREEGLIDFWQLYDIWKDRDRDLESLAQWLQEYVAVTAAPLARTALIDVERLVALAGEDYNDVLFRARIGKISLF